MARLPKRIEPVMLSELGPAANAFGKRDGKLLAANAAVSPARARLKVGRASIVSLTFSHRRELAVAVGSRSPRRAHYRAGCRRTRYLSEAMSQRSRIDDGVASEAAVSD